MELSRRSFLRGALAVIGATVAPALPSMADIPRIVGDGIHDDTAGLQAALDGKPFIADDMVIRTADQLKITKGIFKITEMLTIRRDDVTMEYCSLVGTDLPPHSAMINIEASKVNLSELHMVGNGDAIAIRCNVEFELPSILEEPMGEWPCLKNMPDTYSR